METTKASHPWGDKTYFNMIHVGQKEVADRRAQAQGEIQMSRRAFQALRENTNPKGNVLALAEVAGIMAAKRTAEMLPLCHPLPIDQIKLSFQLDESNSSVLVFCEVSTSAKTGVEMEALSGVNGALLSIYDLSKAVDPHLNISNIRLNMKEGGKSGTWTNQSSCQNLKESRTKPLDGVSAVVITVSDRVSARKTEDTSGPVLLEGLQSLGCRVQFHLVPDEKKEIQAAIFRAVREQGAQIVFTIGGTGLSPRDVTPEAIEGICDRIIPGIGECLRKEGSKNTRMAWLSRSMGALVGNSLVIALPGSRNAVIESLETLKPFLAHALHIVAGGSHD